MGGMICSLKCVQMCIVDSYESVGLLYKSTSNDPYWLRCNVVSTKFTDFVEISAVNLMVLWQEFKCAMKVSKDGFPSVQMIK